jgi:hypothetical protein
VSAVTVWPAHRVTLHVDTVLPLNAEPHATKDAAGGGGDL